jgi:hypothetical protein
MLKTFNKKAILFLLVSSTFILSCEDENLNSYEKVEDKNQMSKDLFAGDIIKDGRFGLMPPSSAKTVLNISLIDNLDTDGDGISDFAEDRIAELDKNNPKDIEKLDAFSTITIQKEDGTSFELPFYQTSYYQNHFCSIPEPTYRQDELSPREMALLKLTYQRWLKILRTPEFQNYILTKPAGKELGMEFLKRARNLNRGFVFRSIPNPEMQGWVGASNLWDYIHVSHWSMEPPFTNYLSTVAHEFIHHIGYGHEHDYAYGGGYKAAEMQREKKYDYEVYDLEQKKFYRGLPSKSIWSAQSSNKVLWYVNFTDFSYKVRNMNWSMGVMQATRKMDLKKGKSYKVDIAVDYSQFVSIWIDFNDDAVFTNDERVLTNGYCKDNAGSSLHFTIPASAKPGKHYMRMNSSINNYFLGQNPSYLNSNNEPSAYGPNAYGSSIDFTNISITD